MSTVYNPEAQMIEEIERLEFEARNIRGKIEHVTNESDRRVMNRQLRELDEEITLLQARIP
ncbi:MAG: hypothetical protein JWN40_2103 [Phycisphaerales bacterium]|nr:hypothetical protein [Phycisphaerales bacterium]